MLLCVVVCVLLCVVVSGCAVIQGRGSAKDGGEFLKINRPYKCLVCELRFCVSLQVCLKDSRATELNILLWGWVGRKMAVCVCVCACVVCS